VKESGDDFEAVLTDPYCSYCGRDLREHSMQDFRDCALRSGGEVSDDGVVIVGAHFKGEDPDPAKRAARRREMRREMTQAVCACGKTFDEHSKEEILACAHKQRDIQLKDVRCPICNKLVLEHSHAEGLACSEKDKAAKRASQHMVDGRG
jgi:hypothetical protein